MNWREEKQELGREIIIRLYQEGMIKTWYRHEPKGWMLISGLWSPFYIQLRTLTSYPELLGKIGIAFGKIIKAECPEVNRIIGIATTGIPIASAVTYKTDMPSCFTRKLEGLKSIEDFDRFIKTYGEHSMIEGVLEDGDSVGLVDDLVTKFDTKLIALKQLEFELKVRKLARVICNHIIVILDREQGGTEAAKQYGKELHSLIPFKSQGSPWLKESFEPEEYEVITDYLDNPQKYQDLKIRAELAEFARVRS